MGSESDSPARQLILRVLDRLKPPSSALPVLNADLSDLSAVPPGGFAPGVFPETPQQFQRSTVSEENDLTLTVFASVTGTMLLGGLIRRPDGSTEPIGPSGSGFQVAFIGDRVPRSVSFPRGSGVDLIGLSAAILTPSPVVLGSIWAIVQQSRLLASGQRVITNTLVSGPVSDTQPLGWPGSPVLASTTFPYQRFVTGTLPGVGQNIVETVPSGARWDLVSFTFNFTSDAVPGNRVIFLQFRPSIAGSAMANCPNSFLQAASVTQTYEYGVGLGLFSLGAGGLTTAPLPLGATLLAGMVIVTATPGFDPGDSYTAPFYLVNERLDP